MSLYASRNQTWTNTVIIQCYWNMTAFQIGCNTNQSSVCVIVVEAAAQNNSSWWSSPSTNSIVMPLISGAGEQWLYVVKPQMGTGFIICHAQFSVEMPINMINWSQSNNFILIHSWKLYCLGSCFLKIEKYVVKTRDGQ